MKNQKVRGYGTQNKKVKSKDVFAVFGICFACVFIIVLTFFFTGNKDGLVKHSTKITEEEKEDIEEIEYEQSDFETTPVFIKEDAQLKEPREVVDEDEIYETESVVVSNTSVLEFSAPLKGEINKGFSDSELVYSKTLEDWRLHTGIDIGAKIGTTVSACADGVVEYAGKDIRYGYTIIISHDESLKTIYSNLTGTQMVKVGKDIKKGDPIGMVGDSAICETADESHLHFEIRFNEINVNPSEYFNI